jgi:hypothetical protein
MPPVRRKLLITLPVVAGICVLAGWLALGAPRSLVEYRFHTGLEQELRAGAQQIALEQLMPSGWELACESHPYDGPLHLARYQRTYPPVADPHDGAWGLVFIARDGSPAYVKGNCTSGARFNLGGCVSRNAATLVRTPESAGSACVTFQAQGPQQ